MPAEQEIDQANPVFSSAFADRAIRLAANVRISTSPTTDAKVSKAVGWRCKADEGGAPGGRPILPDLEAPSNFLENFRLRLTRISPFLHLLCAPAKRPSAFMSASRMFGWAPPSRCSPHRATEFHTTTPPSRSGRTRRTNGLHRQRGLRPSQPTAYPELNLRGNCADKISDLCCPGTSPNRRVTLSVWSDERIRQQSDVQQGARPVAQTGLLSCKHLRALWHHGRHVVPGHRDAARRRSAGLTPRKKRSRGWFNQARRCLATTAKPFFVQGLWSHRPARTPLKRLWRSNWTLSIKLTILVPS